LQTVMHSDKIIVLEDGKIENEWKHLELLEKSKIYKTLVDLQNGEIVE
jgi:ATP-binding cassette subfamily B protein